MSSTKAALHPYSIVSNWQKEASVCTTLIPCHLSFDSRIFSGLLFLIPLGNIIFNLISSLTNHNFQFSIQYTCFARMQDCKIARFYLFLIHAFLPLFSTQPSLFHLLMILYKALSLNSLSFSLRNSCIPKGDGPHCTLPPYAGTQP